jgi:hypothetical protein
MTYKGVARGRTIELDESLPFPEGEPVSVSVQPLKAKLGPGSAEEQPGESLEAKYQRLLDESGLFVKFSEEEKRRYQPISEERRKEVADKIGAAGPLSEAIIEERGSR